MSKRITRLRWQVPIVAFILVLVHQILEHTWLIGLARWQHFTSQLIFYGVVGPALAWWTLTTLRERVLEREAAERALQEALEELNEANQRLELLIRVGRRMFEAGDEDALVEVMLDLPVEVVPALGCSFIRFDEHDHPRYSIHRGDLEPETFKAWSDHLSSGDLRRECQHCSLHWATDADTCPLIKPYMESTPVKKLHCLEIARGSRRYGVLILFLEDPASPGDREKELLDVLADEMALAWEGVRLRSQELTTLYRMQSALRTRDLQENLIGVLEHLTAGLDAGGAVMYVKEILSDRLQPLVQIGQSPGDILGLIKGLGDGASQASSPILINDLAQDEADGGELRSMLVAPLLVEDERLGYLALWAKRPNVFSRRRMRLIATIAGQAALLIENHRLYLQAEHQAALAERARLAGEIHDGLAQTLGYLQMRTSQILGWIGQGDVERAVAALGKVEDLLDEAYVDAREAIDAMRLAPEGGEIEEWIDRLSRDFEAASGIPVEIGDLPDLNLPVDIASQVLRIIQEALGNIRKHSEATRASIQWIQDGNWTSLRIADNGKGFDPQEVPPIAHHGLRIMKERAELIEADFQVVSRSEEGTQVIVRLPYVDKSRESGNG